MTTRALVRHYDFDYDSVRSRLRARVTAVRAEIRGRSVAVSLEPLFIWAAGGGLLQSIRLDLDGGKLGSVTVTTEGGILIPSEQIAIPQGVRVMVPEVDEPTRLRLTLPDHDPDTSIAVTLLPQRHWTIHLVHHSHLDIGYTDPQGTVLGEQSAYLDACLDLIDETDEWPEAARFRWAVESLWSFELWSASRPEARVAEFIERAKQGRIELTAMPFNLHTETCSTDELHEMLRLARDVRDRYGIQFTTAMQTDVPGAVSGLVDALSQSGVRYLSVAHNWAGRSVPHLVGGQDVPRLFRWRAPSGASVLVWMTDTPHGMAYMEGPMLGFDISYDVVDAHLPAYLTSLATNPYPYEGFLFGFPAAAAAPLHREPYPWDILHLRVQGRFADNAPPRRIMSEIVRRWNETWAYPRLRLSRNEDFFTEAEERYGASVPEFTGDWNDWWADGIGSGARPLQMVRRAQGDLADAQTVSTLAGLSDADSAASAAKDTADARAVYLQTALFDEHTWGAADPWTHGDHHHQSGEEQWHWKYGTALRARDGALQLLDRATVRFGLGVGTAPGALVSLHVVNTCSWPRTETVTAFLPESRVPLDQAVSIVDARSRKRLPFDELPQHNPDHREAGRFLRAVVDSVPAMGSVRLDVRPGDGPAEVVPRMLSGAQPVLENEHLRVEVDLGTASIASIVDKATGRELVNTSADFRFNAYVYDKYASVGGMPNRSLRIEDDDSLRMLGNRSLARPAALVSWERDATGERLIYESGAMGADWIRTTLILPHGSARLDIENRLAKPATPIKESAFFAFPFSFGQPSVRADATGGVTGTGIPFVPGGATHMRAIRRWIALQEDGFAVAWSTQDAPLVQLGEIVVPYAPFPASSPSREPATVYSWIHNNVWDTNFPTEQAFEMTFRYSVASCPAHDEVAASVLGLHTSAATSRPLRAVLAASWRATEDEPAERAWLSVDDDRVRVVGLTTPEPGWVLVRLQSVAPTPLGVVVRAGFPVKTARRATFLGEPGEPWEGGDPRVEIPAFGTTGVLLERRFDDPGSVD